MIEVRPLNNALKEIAQQDLNEVESRIANDLEALKLWIGKQPHLRARIDDQYLLAFLRGSKHSLEKAKSKIDYFYTIKTLVPELFREKRMNKKFLEFAQKGIYTWVPKPLSPDAPNIAILRFHNFNVKNFKLADIFKYRTFAIEHYLKENDNCIVAGYVFIIDLEKVPYTLYSQIDMAMSKKLGVFGKKALPIRYKGIHLLNFKTEYTELLNFVKTLMPEKYRKRLFVHKTLDELYKHVSKDYLPKEYGGTNITLDEMVKQNLQQMLDINEFLIEDDKYGVDERLRANNDAMNINSVFGLEGSFRKLDID